ncbi:MAG: hypothetical protein DI620_00835 [Haemophilus parainfluenzae]|jgi:hypothetical protein|nr:MAG: hypothetical protein DI620_00835 [Haemophilus parainfluenzae]
MRCTWILIAFLPLIACRDLELVDNKNAKEMLLDKVAREIQQFAPIDLGDIQLMQIKAHLIEEDHSYQDLQQMDKLLSVRLQSRKVALYYEKELSTLLTKEMADALNRDYSYSIKVENGNQVNYDSATCTFRNSGRRTAWLDVHARCATDGVFGGGGGS